MNESQNQIEKKGQPIDANIKVTEMLELSNKDFKAAMIKSFIEQL